MLFEAFPFEIIIYILNKCSSIDLINCTKLDRINRKIVLDIIHNKKMTLETYISKIVNKIRDEYYNWPKDSYFYDISIEFTNKTLVEYHSFYNRYKYLFENNKLNTFRFYLHKGLRNFNDTQIKNLRKVMKYEINISLLLFGEIINFVLYESQDKFDFLSKCLELNKSCSKIYIDDLIQLIKELEIERYNLFYYYLKNTEIRNQIIIDSVYSMNRQLDLDKFELFINLIKNYHIVQKDMFYVTRIFIDFPMSYLNKYIRKLKSGEYPSKLFNEIYNHK